MKKTILLVLAVCLIAGAYAQEKDTRDLPTFKRLSFGVSGKLYLRQGSPQKVVLEGNRDVIDKIITEVRGDRLVIRNENEWFDWRGWRDDRRVTVYVTMSDVEGLSVSGSGDLVAETLITSNSLDLIVSGSGQLVAEFTVNGDVEADVSGSGNVKIKGKCRNFDGDISGSGEVSFDGDIASDARFDITGSGKMQSRGSAKLAKAWISGSGKVMAGELEVARCEVKITGSGDVQINVKDELDARISGSGSVSYRGNPSHINSNSSGSGKVRKM